MRPSSLEEESLGQELSSRYLRDIGSIDAGNFDGWLRRWRPYHDNCVEHWRKNYFLGIILFSYVASSLVDFMLSTIMIYNFNLTSNDRSKKKEKKE